MKLVCICGVCGNASRYYKFSLLVKSLFLLAKITFKLVITAQDKLFRTAPSSNVNECFKSVANSSPIYNNDW